MMKNGIGLQAFAFSVFFERYKIVEEIIKKIGNNRLSM